MPASEARTRALMYGMAGAVFATDRLTKWLIETRVSAFDSHTVIPGFFDIVHSQNSGAAFGLFADSASQWRSVLLIGFSFVALVVLAGMLWRSAHLDRKTAVALALIFGGALGNVFDCPLYGIVVIASRNIAEDVHSASPFHTLSFGSSSRITSLFPSNTR